MGKPVILGLNRHHLAILEYTEVGARCARHTPGDQRGVGLPRQLRLAQAYPALCETAGDAGPAAACGIWRWITIRPLNEGRVAPEAEEANQRIVIFEHTATSGQRQAISQIEADFTERRIVPVDPLLPGQPQCARTAVDRQQGREIGDLIILKNLVALPLVKQPADKAQALILRRCDAQLLAQLLEMIRTDNLLARADRIARRIREIEIARYAANRGIERIIGLGIIGIVARLVGLAVEIGTRIGDIPVADFPLDG